MSPFHVHQTTTITTTHHQCNNSNRHLPGTRCRCCGRCRSTSLPRNFHQKCPCTVPLIAVATTLTRTLPGNRCKCRWVMSAGKWRIFGDDSTSYLGMLCLLSVYSLPDWVLAAQVTTNDWVSFHSRMFETLFSSPRFVFRFSFPFPFPNSHPRVSRVSCFVQSIPVLCYSGWVAPSGHHFTFLGGTFPPPVFGK